MALALPTMTCRRRPPGCPSRSAELMGAASELVTGGRVGTARPASHPWGPATSFQSISCPRCCH